MDLGRVGVWSAALRTGDRAEVADAAAELEELGFGALWFPGGAEREVLPAADVLLDATKRVAVATGIVNIWATTPEALAREYTELAERHPDRFLLGLGVGHARSTEEVIGRHYERPYSEMVRFLDGLDSAPTPVPIEARALAALGPRMLELARHRSAGAHPYFSDPAHTAFARGVLGEEKLLAPELMVVLDDDPDAAREIARATAARYLALPNYANNLRRLGFSDEELQGAGSDRLLEAVICIGDEAAIETRVAAHLYAGADHVCIQVLTSDATALARTQWRRLADALNLG